MSIEFGRKPYISKSYAGMMKRVPNKAVWNQRLVKQSEFEKPYKDENYSEMQHYFPTNHLPGADYPGMPVGGIPIDECARISKELAETIKLSMFGSQLIWQNAKVVQLFNEYVAAGCPLGPTMWWGCSSILGVEYPAGKNCLSVGETAKIVFEQNFTDPIVNFETEGPLSVTITGTEPKFREGESWVTGKVYIDVTLIGEVETSDQYATSLKITAITKSSLECWSSVLICHDPCDCTGISIGYTTNQMSVNEQQNLTVVGSVEGCTYTWGLSGGGSLSVNEGTATTYTAPSTNPNCESNATITLSVAGTQCDSLQIAVDSNTGGIAGYDAFCERGRSGGRCSWQIYKYNYYCNGDVGGIANPCSTGHSIVCTVDEYWAWYDSECIVEQGNCLDDCSDGCEDGYHDTRTLEQKGYGCCPEAFL